MEPSLALPYLEKAYSRVIVPDCVTVSYAGRILEFPGCFAQGETVEEAYANLEDAAHDWILAALDAGQEIPPPAEEQTHSGRILLRLPRSLHRRAAELAEQEGTSLNQLILAAVAERLGAGAARAASAGRQSG